MSKIIYKEYIKQIYVKQKYVKDLPESLSKRVRSALTKMKLNFIFREFRII